MRGSGLASRPAAASAYSQAGAGMRAQACGQAVAQDAAASCRATAPVTALTGIVVTFEWRARLMSVKYVKYLGACLPVECYRLIPTVCWMLVFMSLER